MTELHILHLGAGVGSTALYYLAIDRRLPPTHRNPNPHIDLAIFADTHAETPDTYDHLQRMLRKPPIPILTCSAGDLTRTITHPTEQRNRPFLPIPAYTAANDGSTRGVLKRQCTRQFKVEPLDQLIRTHCLNLQPRQRRPPLTRIIHYYGFTHEEQTRAARTETQIRANNQTDRGAYPLIDLAMNRRACIAYLERRLPWTVNRSACYCCPYRRNDEWLRIKTQHPTCWKTAIHLDETLREPNHILQRNDPRALYLHETCRPLIAVQLTKPQLNLF
jgi:hypothetical protein